MAQVIGVALSIAVVGIASALQLSRQRVLTDLCTRRGEDEVLAVTTSVELIEFDRPGFHDSVERAMTAVRHLPGVIATLTGLVRALAGAVGAFVALLAVNPLFAPVLLLVAIPTSLAARRRVSLAHDFARGMISRDRERRYIAGLLADRDAAKEVRAYDLAAFLGDRRGRLWDERLRELRQNARRQSQYSVVADLAVSALVGAALLGLIELALSHDIGLADAGLTAAAVIVLGQRTGRGHHQRGWAVRVGGASSTTTWR